MFETVLAALDGTGLEGDHEELLDALWLARRLPPDAAAPLARRLAQQRQAEASTPEKSAVHPPSAPSMHSLNTATHPRNLSPTQIALYSASADLAVRTAAVWLPGTRSLHDGQAISRSIRPLRRTVPDTATLELDEIATADLQADTTTALLVLRPRPERWMRLVLVIDAGVPMLLWERHCAELTAVFERSSAFRHVETHQIRHHGQAIRVGRPWSTEPATRSAHSLTDPSGRTMILIISNGTWPAWRDGRMHELLTHWAATGPIAIIHTLPITMWAGSAVDGDAWHVSNPRAGAANAAWKVTHPFLPAEIAPFDATPIPIVPLTAAGLSTWAAVMTKTDRPIAVRLWERPGPIAEDHVISAPAFARAASMHAVRLAAHLAAAAPLTISVMQLVDSCVYGDTDPARLAEVFLSGLLKPITPGRSSWANPRHRFFDFAPEDKDVLLEAVSTDELFDTSLKVGKHLESFAGRSHLFPAWLTVPSDDETAEPSPYPFARVSPTFLQRFAQLAERASRQAKRDRQPEAHQAHKSYWIDWMPAAIDAATMLYREDKLGAQLVLAAVYELGDDPRPRNSINLGRGGLRRLMLGYYRVLYKVSEKNSTVSVRMVAKAPHPPS